MAHSAAMAAVHWAAFPLGQGWDADGFASQLALPGVFGFVAEPGGLVLARALAGEAELLTLAVVPPARRLGLGRSLLQAAMAEAARRGAATIWLEVAEGNLAGRGLYTASGFTVSGRRPRYYRDGQDALVMRCPLGAALSLSG